MLQKIYHPIHTYIFLCLFLLLLPAHARANEWLEWQYVASDTTQQQATFAARAAQALRSRLKRRGIRGVYAGPTLKHRVRVCIRLRTRVVYVGPKRQRRFVYHRPRQSNVMLSQLFRQHRAISLHIVEDDEISKALFTNMDRHRPPGIQRRIEGYARDNDARTNSGFARFFYSTKRAPLEAWIGQWNRKLQRKPYRLYLHRAERLGSNNEWQREWRSILVNRRSFATHSDFKWARTWKHPKAEQWAVDLVFSRAGSKRLQQTTGRHVGQRIAFVVGGVVRKTTIIPQQLQHGILRIPPHSLKTPEQMAQDVKSLALLLQTALPGPIKRHSARTLSPGTPAAALCRTMEEQAVPRTTTVGAVERQEIVIGSQQDTPRKNNQRAPFLLQSSTSQSCLATLHGSLCLSLPLFTMLYRKALKRYRVNRREAKVDPLGTKLRFLQRCIDQIVLAREAWRRGQDVSELDQQRLIEANPEFAVDGQFVQSLYESKLKNWLLTDREYKQWLRIENLAHHFRSQQQNRVMVSVEEARRYFQSRFPQIQLRYLKFDAQAFRPDVPGLSPQKQDALLQQTLRWLLQQWRQQPESRRLLARLQKTLDPSQPTSATPLPPGGRPAQKVLRELWYVLRSRHQAWQTPVFFRHTHHRIPGLGPHPSLQQRVFRLTPARPFYPQPVRIGAFYYLIKLHRRWTPQADTFRRERSELMRRLRRLKYLVWEQKALRILRRRARARIHKKNLL